MKFTINKRKDGIYYAEKMYKGKRYYFTSKDKNEVEKQLLDFERNKKDNIVLEHTPMTVSQWANKWIDMYKKNVTKGTYDMYADAIRLYITPCIGNIKLVDLKQAHILNMLNSLGSHYRSKENSLLTIKQILEKAVENDYISKNVAHTIKLKRTKAKEKSPLSDELINVIKQIIKDNPDMFIFYFMLYTGVRSGEVVAIKGKDINLNNKTISIDKSYDFKHSEIKSVKNEEARIIPLFDVILPSIKLLNTKKNNYLFPQKNDNIMTYTVLKRKIKKLKKLIQEYYDKENKNRKEEEQIQPDLDFTIHTLRHTYACILYKAGITAKQAQKWTGHKDIQVLLNIYTHLDEKDNKTAIDKVNSYVSTS